MITFTICSGVTVTASRAVYNRFCAERREAQVMADLMAWLADPANADSADYSDIYKDVHGIRPRG